MSEYNYSNLTGSLLLRADSHSQENENNTKVLISNEQFWGNDRIEGLYYDYQAEENKSGYTVSCEGWNDYRETEKMNIEQTNDWIDDNIFKNNKNNICIIQGYAGCGKTTFVHNILRKIYEKNIYLGYYNFYIGYVKNASEEWFIPSCILLKIISQITTYLQEDDGMEIYDKFVELFRLDLSLLSPILDFHFASIFNSKNDASLYECAKRLYDNRNASNKDCYINEFRVQFKCSYQAKVGLANNNGITNMLEILLFIDYILRCSVYLVRNQQEKINQIVVYDNLDIIENHQFIADFIDTLRSVLSNYISFRKNLDLQLPIFKAIVSVRKITYASISKFVEVSSIETNGEFVDVEFLDISNLYLPSNILKHKAKILVKNIDEYVPDTVENRNSIVSFLNEILRIPDEIFLDIKFAELLNHNIRACINMMEQIIKSSTYTKYFSDNYFINRMNNRCKSSVWIHIICTVLKANNVWDNLGYNLSNSNKYNNPTTMSRLILTYLSNRRLGCIHNEPGFTTLDVSLKDIIKSIEKIPFGRFNKFDDWENNICPILENTYTESGNHEDIIDIILKMLQRNNSTEEIELWRRPIYHTHNSFSLSNISTARENLLEQIKHFDKRNLRITSFCITDEGYTFIEKIATHFEFYSIRYNRFVKEPICCVLEDGKLNNFIEKVYNQVEICTKKQIWLMNFYMKKHGVLENYYLKEWFHPRTDGFKPQLHIVRTIYDHIGYLNDYREYLYEAYKDDSSIFVPLNYSLVKWIGKYLELYRKYLFDKLKNTIEQYNNEIWLDLKYLYWLVFKDDEKKGINIVSKKENRFITISRNKNNIFRTKQNDIRYPLEYRITDDELLNEQMLLD